VEYTPVLAGVCASDPFRNIPRFLRELRDLGFAGVQVSINTLQPTCHSFTLANRTSLRKMSILTVILRFYNLVSVGLIDGAFRQNLEETGMGYNLEIEMVREAATLGLLTTP
jgi:predicted TIM-barrel enzyme